MPKLAGAGLPPTLEEIRTEGREDRFADVPRWRNPYTPSADSWCDAWYAGWDEANRAILSPPDPGHWT